ncbi:hypothetical protein [Desulfosporosinus sp. BICA1-9]|uniref:hypothetical protein n=1 Tax=Desulfosporosinus sp. BICA1-9 TaxID=1531958 RepID=UPI00054BF939|nr:hypothetical protein [Desulfosporosinus sp. BICA1-9]KJS49693.1 MAG: hypothetical protein VR66_07100 [Peptococcaceae bacterium BRH_c23]KJS87446.1 MAG: hypothetical protein JL57_14100 [Desulfosporosinus sp. BICA1-9]
MLVAICARSANENDVIMQVKNCRQYILKNWNLETQIKLFTEIVEGPQNLEICLELQKLLKEANYLDAVVVSHPLSFFSHIMNEFIIIYKIIGRRKIHYAIYLPTDN